eukprot:5830837-Ditylum_brightwellii.AAC.1
MPDYVCKALKKFKHTKLTHPQYAPHRWNQLAYGQKVQHAVQPNPSDLLDPKGKRLLQLIVRTLLYYARVVDLTILATLNDIGTQ